MPYNGSGTFLPLAPPIFPAVAGTTVRAAYYNQMLEDMLNNGLSRALVRDGQAAMTGVLSMGGFKISGVGTPAMATDAATKGYTDTQLAKLGPVLRLENYGGGAGAPAATNNAAWAALLADMSYPARGTVLLNSGVYEFSTAVETPAFAVQLMFVGQGRGRTVIKQLTDSIDVFAVPAGATCHSLTFQDMTFRGAGYAAGSQRGLYLPESTTDAFNVQLLRANIEEVAGNGAHFGNTFTLSLNSVDVNDVGGHGIYARGGNTTLMQSCYVHNLRTLGSQKAAYRVMDGQLVMISCNGVDQGDYWGDFGQSTALGDPTNTAMPVLMLGCNVEDYRVTGVRHRGGWLVLQGGTWVSYTSGVVKALDINSNNGGGSLDRDVSFNLGGGATWANGYPVHTASLHPPFQHVISGATGSSTFTFWDDAAGAAVSMPTWKTAYYRPTLMAISLDALYTRIQRLENADTATFAGSGLVAVTFTTPLPDTSYSINLAPNANETIWWENKTAAGFTIRSSNASSTASVDWQVFLRR